MEQSANLNGKTTSPGLLDVCDYVDIVEGQRHQFDTLFALKRWRPSPVLSPETTRAITEKILQTNRVKDTVLSLIDKGQGTSEEINNEARKILQEMGHTFDLKTVRMLGFVLAKLLRQLYQGVMVNQPGIIKMSNAMSEAPVLFLPTHRSYADFLLISYICYTLAIPLPVIAAGMDFKGMKFINKVLQNAGAFYIRRSFGNDLLYWAAVSEYVRHQVLNFQAPIEFFLEGTRSRNGKSLPPKIGLLIMALESYFRGDVPDIQICTMSISYERTLEENLYAYEILGIPKPRESTSGFFSAVDKIRGQNYGRIYTKISDPISVRECLRKREVPNWTLPSFRFSLNEEEKERIHSFAWELVQRQQKEAITPVSAVLFSLLQWRQLSLDHLENFFIIFNNVLAVHGTSCFIQSRVELAIKECLDAHKHSLQCDRQTVYSYKLPLTDSADLQSRAAARLVVQSYTNQLLGPLINLATFGYIQSKLPNCDDFNAEYSFFAKFFKDEFVLIRTPNSEDLTAFKNLDPVVLEVLSPLLQPFVESFYIILYLLDVGFDNVKQLQTQYRNVATLLLEEGASNYLEILAVDKVSRHLLNLVTNGNLQLLKSNGITKYSASDVSSLMRKLELYLNQRFRHCLAEFREKSVQIHSQL